MLILFSIDNWGVSEAKSKKIIFKKIFCTQFFSQKLKVDAFSKSLFGRIWSSHGQLFAKIAFLNFSELLCGLGPSMMVILVAIDNWDVSKAKNTKIF